MIDWLIDILKMNTPNKEIYIEKDEDLLKEIKTFVETLKFENRKYGKKNEYIFSRVYYDYAKKASQHKSDVYINSMIVISLFYEALLPLWYSMKNPHGIEEVKKIQKKIIDILKNNQNYRKVVEEGTELKKGFKYFENIKDSLNKKGEIGLIFNDSKERPEFLEVLGNIKPSTGDFSKFTMLLIKIIYSIEYRGYFYKGGKPGKRYEDFFEKMKTLEKDENIKKQLEEVSKLYKEGKYSMETSVPEGFKNFFKENEKKRKDREEEKEVLSLLENSQASSSTLTKKRRIETQTQNQKQTILDQFLKPKPKEVIKVLSDSDNALVNTSIQEVAKVISKSSSDVSKSTEQPSVALDNNSNSNVPIQESTNVGQNLNEFFNQYVNTSQKPAEPISNTVINIASKIDEVIEIDEGNLSKNIEYQLLYYYNKDIGNIQKEIKNEIKNLKINLITRNNLLEMNMNSLPYHFVEPIKNLQNLKYNTGIPDLSDQWINEFLSIPITSLLIAYNNNDIAHEVCDIIQKENFLYIFIDEEGLDENEKKILLDDSIFDWLKTNFDMSGFRIESSKEKNVYGLKYKLNRLMKVFMFTMKNNEKKKVTLSMPIGMGNPYLLFYMQIMISDTIEQLFNPDTRNGIFKTIHLPSEKSSVYTEHIKEMIKKGFGLKEIEDQIQTTTTTTTEVIPLQQQQQLPIDPSEFLSDQPDKERNTTNEVRNTVPTIFSLFSYENENENEKENENENENYDILGQIFKKIDEEEDDDDNSQKFVSLYDQ